MQQRHVVGVLLDDVAGEDRDEVGVLDHVGQLACLKRALIGTHTAPTNAQPNHTSRKSMQLGIKIPT